LGIPLGQQHTLEAHGTKRRRWGVKVIWYGAYTVTVQ
jgi:hypothetical protein